MKRKLFSKLLLIGGIFIAAFGIFAWKGITNAATSYTYTLNFNANGGSGAPSYQTVTTSNSSIAGSVTIPSTKPTRSGYTFLGWSTSSTATTASYQPGSKYTFCQGTYTGCNPVTLYAVWQSSSSASTTVSYAYTLNFNANSGSGAPSTQTYTGTTNSHAFTIPNTTPTRSGYTFLGWSTSSTATTASYQPGGSYTMSTATVSSGTAYVYATLYAVWQQNTTTSHTYTLYYNANGGSGAPGTQTATSTSTIYDMVVSNTTPTRSGYTFLGWSTSSSDTSGSIEPGSIYRMYSSYLSTATLYAIWQSNSSTDTNNNTNNTNNTENNTNNDSTNTNNNNNTNTGSNTSNNNTTTSYAIDNTGIVYASNSGGIAIRGSGDLAKFVSLKIDGSVVNSSNYALSSGSTVVTLGLDYLATLSEGVHPITMTWTDGEASSNLAVASDDQGVVYAMVASDATISSLQESSSDGTSDSTSTASEDSSEDSSAAATAGTASADGGTAAPKTGVMTEEDGSISAISIVKFLAIAAATFFASIYVYNRFIKHRSARKFANHSDWE